MSLLYRPLVRHALMLLIGSLMAPQLCAQDKWHCKKQTHTVRFDSLGRVAGGLPQHVRVGDALDFNYSVYNDAPQLPTTFGKLLGFDDSPDETFISNYFKVALGLDHPERLCVEHGVDSAINLADSILKNPSTKWKRGITLMIEEKKHEVTVPYEVSSTNSIQITLKELHFGDYQATHTAILDKAEELLLSEVALSHWQAYALVAMYHMRLKHITKPKTTINSFTLHVGEPGLGKDNRWMRHYDAANKYRPMQKPLKSGYLNNEEAYIAVHNVPDSMAVTLDFGRKDIEDAPRTFAQGVIADLPQPETLMEGIRLGLKGLLKGAQDKDDSKEKGKDLECPPIPATTRDSLLTVLDDIRKYLLSTTPRYRSVCDKADNADWGPLNVYQKKVTYTISERTPTAVKAKKPATDKKTGTYRERRRHWVDVFGGIVGTLNKQQSLSYSRSEGYSAQSFGHVRPYIGFKVYPMGPDLGRPSFILQKRNVRENGSLFDYTRLHLVLGADPVHITRSFFVGGGLDLFLGWSVNAGVHLVRASQPVVTGVIQTDVETKLRAGLFIGTSLDISTFSKLILPIF